MLAWWCWHGGVGTSATTNGVGLGYWAFAHFSSPHSGIGGVGMLGAGIGGHIQGLLVLPAWSCWMHAFGSAIPGIRAFSSARKQCLYAISHSGSQLHMN